MRVEISDFVHLLYMRVLFACMRACRAQHAPGATRGKSLPLLTWRTRFFEFCFASMTKTAGLPELEVARATAGRRNGQACGAGEVVGAANCASQKFMRIHQPSRALRQRSSPHRRSATALRLPRDAERWPARVMLLIERVMEFIVL